MADRVVLEQAGDSKRLVRLVFVRDFRFLYSIVDKVGSGPDFCL